MPNTKLVSGKKVTLSVNIINKNERGIEDTLRLLSKQRLTANYEIIVVDASKGALDDIYHKYPTVKIIPFISKSKKSVTIPEQRNVGIRASSGSIIVFIDAGCEPGKNWLAELVAPIIEGTELITAGGTLSSGTPTFHDAVYEQQKSLAYIGQAPTINLAVAKKVFKKIGYFDENLRYGSDMDLTWRARAEGYKIRNVPDALMTHDWGDFKQELKRANHYGQAKVILYRKHRYGLLNFIKREFALCFYVGYVIFLPITFWFPYYPLLILLPIFKNIKSNPLNLVPINFVTAYGAAKEFLHLT